MEFWLDKKNRERNSGAEWDGYYLVSFVTVRTRHLTADGNVLCVKRTQMEFECNEMNSVVMEWLFIIMVFGLAL